MSRYKFPVIFGIDVSKANSNVSVLVERHEIDHFVINNDALGFGYLLDKLQYYTNPLVIFEATGVYSLPLQAFIEKEKYAYIRINPLKAKRINDNNIRHAKTDRLDAKNLGLIPFNAPQRLTQPQPLAYREMEDASRFYEELTRDLVTSKNRLHRALQSTFPQIESLFANHTGIKYWKIIKSFPHSKLVLNKSPQEINQLLVNIKGIGKRKANNLTRKLIALAKLAVPYDKPQGIGVKTVQYWATRLLEITAQRQHILAYLLKINPNPEDLKNITSIPGIAQPTALRLIAELGNIKRFDKPSQIDAYVGVDPKTYESGQNHGDHLGITKHGNPIARKLLYRAIGQIDNASRTRPCHIADYYERKKRSSSDINYKKIAIACVHKLIRTIYALITKDQSYDYQTALYNQR